MTVNDYTRDQDLSEAVLVVSSLGDPHGERPRCGPTGAGPGPAPI